ncbi:MAG: 4-(cytidine 5'-diphospho)-2-C-methyl-D-erythritol kinase [Planctomycetota bacterium]
MTTLRRSAPAKINLTLRVGGRRPDGFHEIESLVALVDLADSVEVTDHEDGCYSLECDEPTLPRDGSNLVLRAARALAQSAEINRGAEITLTKRIPAGAGLGGGSSDAAATLMLLNDLWGTRRSPAELEQLGATLGSDVPLFFHGPLSVVRGRGEHVARGPGALRAWVGLVLPAIACPTPAVYAEFDRLPAPPARPTLDEVRAALDAPDRLMGLLFNDLEAAAARAVPELGRLMERVATEVGGPVRLTGSGSAFYRLFAQRAATEQWAEDVRRKLGIRGVVAQTLA